MSRCSTRSRRGSLQHDPDHELGAPPRERVCLHGDTPPIAGVLRTLVMESPMADVISVRVKPGSRKGPLVETAADGELTVYVREPAVEGKANEAVVKLLAKHLGVAPSRLDLVSGATSRVKRFRVR
jgi:uncharacterized protein